MFVWNKTWDSVLLMGNVFNFRKLELKFESKLCSIEFIKTVLGHKNQNCQNPNKLVKNFIAHF